MAAISYDGSNFLEIKRVVGDRIEKGNKFTGSGSVLVLDTPYGVQRVLPGNVLIRRDNWWQVVSQEEFTARFEIVR